MSPAEVTGRGGQLPPAEVTGSGRSGLFEAGREGLANAS